MDIAKLKKTVLIAGMTTALNLGMGLENGGYTMMSEEHGSVDTDLTYGEKYYLCTLANIQKGHFTKDHYNDLAEKADLYPVHNISNQYDFTINTSLLDEMIEIIAIGHYHCGDKTAANYKKFLEMIKQNLDDPRPVSGYLQYFIKDIQRDLRG